MTYNIRPEKHELRKARKSVEAAFESCKYTVDKNKVLTVNLGSSSDENYGAHGIAANSEEAQIYFNPNINGWEDDLKKTAINVYGTAWFYEKTENLAFVWQDLLASTAGLLLLDKIGESREPKTEGLKSEWSEKKGLLGEEISAGSERSFSWELKLVLGRELLEEYELDELPELNFSDVKDSGKKAF